MKEYLEIINNFGIKNQCKKYNEEAYELIEAIVEGDKEHITEEIADNLILLTQFLAKYEIPKDKLDEKIKFKLERTKERISSGYYDNKQ